MFESLKELLGYRYMIRNLVKREIRGRYKGSVLGFIWNFIVPLVQILVYVIVFSAIFKPGIENYPIYLTSGMIAWFFFSDSLIEGSGTFVGNSDMLKKIYFPRSVLPISVVLSKMVNFLITLGIFFILIAILGYGVSVEALLFLIPVMIIYLIFTLGLSLLFSSINVYLRDIQYIISVLMMVWIWMTPIMYLRNSYENAILDFIVKYNPMTYFTELFQSILYWKAIPDTYTIVVSCILALLSITAGTIVFKLLENNFAEVL